MSHARRTFALVAGAALALTIAPTAAQAADRPAQAPQGAVALAGLDGVLADSEFLAGHAGAGGDTLTATFVVPDIACEAGTDSGIFPSAIAFETIGESVFVNGGGGVFATCSAGVETYSGAMLDASGGQTATSPVAAGDKVRVTYSDDGTNSTTVFENLTTGTTDDTGPQSLFDTTDSQVGDNGVLLGGIEVPAPSLGKHKFTNVQVDGAKLRKSTGWTKFNLVDGAGDPVLKSTKAKKGKFLVKDA